MSIERYSERHGIVLARIPDGLPDDLLMTQVHTIEKTDRKAHPRIPPQLNWIMDCSHRSWLQNLQL